MSKKTAVVICPGRGTYNKTELGYLHRFHSDKKSFVDKIDRYRASKGAQSIWELDGKPEYLLKEHVPGENAASLIYACSYTDFLSIDRNKYDIVAVTGNSMGWYLACAAAGALSEENAIHIVDTMGSQMKERLIGGQILYPEVDEEWHRSSELTALIDQKILQVNQIDGCEAYTSIYFGGFRVIGGNEAALKWLLKELPQREERYPFKLMGNAAFHTPMLTETSLKAKREMGPELFQSPEIPLVDGRGKIWMPHSSDLTELWDYTLGNQVDCLYHFSRAVEVAIKEFNPDCLILTGPGTTMGGAVAHILIDQHVQGLTNKNDFKKLQETNPYILSMGGEQRSLVV